MSKTIDLQWTDEDGDDWHFEVVAGNQFNGVLEWDVSVFHGTAVTPVCELTVPTASIEHPPSVRDIAEEMAHHFCSIAIRMVEAG